jgi:cellulose synthase (UDP-forming)
VIDDGRDDRVRDLAASVGATYITRPDTLHHKAGNINNALRNSSGDITVIFDIDHIPQPDFLDRAIAWFADPAVGVVQVALDHYNEKESFVAGAAARMSDELFALTMRGMDRLGCAVVFGSNAVFRRQALLSMGGYKPGLAEDLNTSIHLHAAGWKSVYLPELLARGLVPPDLDGFTKQHFKWSRGIFEVLLREMPRLYGRLTMDQRICYATRMTYYLAGPVMAGHIGAAILAPLFPGAAASLGDYLLHVIPFAGFYLAVHVTAFRIFAIKEEERPLDLRGALLVLACWPVYTRALLFTLLRVRDQHVPTPKIAGEGNGLRTILPQSLAVVLLLGSAIVHVATAATPDLPFVLFIVALLTAHTALVPAVGGRKMNHTKGVERDVKSVTKEDITRR